VVKVTDADGKVVREITGPATAGLHRVNWNLRAGGAAPGGGGPLGAPVVKPGKYTVTLVKVVDKDTTTLGEAQVCEVEPLTPPPAIAQPE